MIQCFAQGYKKIMVRFGLVNNLDDFSIKLSRKKQKQITCCMHQFVMIYMHILVKISKNTAQLWRKNVKHCLIWDLFFLFGKEIYKIITLVRDDTTTSKCIKK